MNRRRKELVPLTPAALAAPTNVVGAEVAAIVGELPAGIYRSTLTICRITFDTKGLEKEAQVVSSHCFDFEARPAVLEAAPAAEMKDGAP